MLAALDSAQADASDVQVAYGNTLEFRSCLTAAPSAESGCEEIFKRWYQLARDDAPAFQIEMTRIPTGRRSLWLRQLNAYAARTGESYRIPLQQTAPGPDDVPRKFDHMRTFGPDAR